MQFKSRKQKPPTGLELSVTLMMPEGQTVEQSRDAILKFFDAISNASREIGSAWIRIHCSGIPTELEPALQAALDDTNRRPQLELVVNNASN